MTKDNKEPVLRERPVQPEVRRYRLTWEDKRTGESGFGDWTNSKIEIEIWVNFMNEAYPHILHKIEVKP